MAESRYQTTRENGEDGNPYDQRNVADTTFRRRYPGHGLEVDWQVVEEKEESTAEEEYIETGAPDDAPSKQPPLDEGPVPLKPFVDTKYNDDQPKPDYEADHSLVAPRPGDTSVLKSQDKASHGCHDEETAQEVHLQHLLFEGRLDGLESVGRVEGEEDDGRSNATDGQVDVKTPAPAEVIGEDTPQQRTDDTGGSIGRPEQPGKGRPLLGRSTDGDDCVCARGDARPAGARYGPSNDEGGAGGGNPADKTADLEDEDGQKKAEFEWEILVCLAPSTLKCSQGQEEAGAVPADLIERMELLRDARNGGGDDGHVQGDEEDGDDQGQENAYQPQTCGIGHAVVGRGRGLSVELLLGRRQRRGVGVVRPGLGIDGARLGACSIGLCQRWQ